MRDDFNSKDIPKLAARAGYICSNPYCNTMTIGPSEADEELKANIGIAAHIHAASLRGPRYEGNQKSEDRASIENGIWLCANCAALIDKNKGIDYPPHLLRQWKTEHEKMISHLVKSGNSPLPLIRKQRREGTVAQEILEILDSKGVLFMEPAYERNPYVITSLSEIRGRLTALLHEIDLESPLYGQVRTIIEHCRQYMNEMSNQDDFELMSIRLVVMRKAIGLILKSMCSQYRLRPSPNLIMIMPR
jgi:hypothetical protein